MSSCEKGNIVSSNKTLTEFKHTISNDFLFSVNFPVLPGVPKYLLKFEFILSNPEPGNEYFSLGIIQTIDNIGSFPQNLQIFLFQNFFGNKLSSINILTYPIIHVTLVIILDNFSLFLDILMVIEYLQHIFFLLVFES